MRSTASRFMKAIQSTAPVFGQPSFFFFFFSVVIIIYFMSCCLIQPMLPLPLRKGIVGSDGTPEAPRRREREKKYPKPRKPL